MFITIEQIKAGRALLNWNQEDLARHAALNTDQVRNFESGRSRSLQVLEGIYGAFTAHDVAFVDNGVVRRKNEIRILRGQKGFWDFYDDVYETMRENGGDIFVHNVDESMFVKWQGEKTQLHLDRMSKLRNFNQKILVCEGDTNFVAGFPQCEYRWLHKEEFSSVPFYLYGPKLAMIIFEENDVGVFVLHQEDITHAFKKMFLSIWGKSIIPSKG